MPAAFESELQAAVEAVRAAAVVCRAVQSRIDVEKLDKKDKSPVTVADFASQAIVCRILSQHFPNDSVVGEEDASELRLPQSQPFLQQVLDEVCAAGHPGSAAEVCGWIDRGFHEGASSRFWTLDPIDGTKGFLRKEQYAISLALIVDGQIEVAALCCPNLSGADAWDKQRGAVFSAQRGQGAMLQLLDNPAAPSRSVRVTATRNPAMARVCESVEAGHSSHDQSSAIAAHLGITAPSVRLDSQAKYGVVARGEADLYLRLPTKKDYFEKIWDHAGGVLVVEEAGGKVTDVDGKPLDFSLGWELRQNRGVVVSNGLLHDAVLQAIRATTPTGLV